MSNILTVSLNPALDSASDIEKVVADVKLRSLNAYLDAGGGGVNVSRAIKYLGGQSLGFVAVGGATGNMLIDLLNIDGVQVSRFDGPGQTRQNFAVTELSTGAQFRFGQPGPQWDDADVDRALAQIKSLISSDMIVVGSGSLPSGVRHEFYGELHRIVVAKGGKTILDTGQAGMAAALKTVMVPHYVLRMNRHESNILAGRELKTLNEATYFARSMILQDKAEIVILARGAEGSLIVSGDDCFTCTPPQIKVISKVGAGDSFVAALTLGLSRGWPLRRAAQFGTAAAAAACMSKASKLCTLPDVQTLQAQTVVSDA